MKVWLGIVLYVLGLPLYLLFAEELNEFEKITGFRGIYNQSEKVFKASFPRTDIKVSVNGWPLDPFMGLTSWVAFSPMNGNNFMIMGDLVLFEDEVNFVMSILFENNLNVTALHNHFFFDEPRVYFMHIEGVGSIQTLSNGVKKVMEKIKEYRLKHPNINTKFDDSPSSFKNNSIIAKNLESIFGVQGQSKEGMVKFTFGRKIKMFGFEFGKEMGVNSWAAFGGTNENAFVDGDFTMTEEELQPILRVLRKGNINVVAIHNHMTMESPRTIFLHFWGIGKAEELAKTIKEALQVATP